MAADARYDPFDPAWTRFREAQAHLLAGRLDRYLEMCAGLEGQPGTGHVLGKCGLLFALPHAGRDEEARAIAEDTLAAARAHANPWCIALALYGFGRAFAPADPARALRLFREGLAYAQAHRLSLFETTIAHALLETLHGDPGRALALFDTPLRTGNEMNPALVFSNLAVCFDRIDQPDVAATIYGASTLQAASQYVLELPGVVGHLRAVPRRHRLRQLRRHRGRHGRSRRSRVRPTPHRTRPPPSRQPRLRPHIITTGRPHHRPWAAEIIGGMSGRGTLALGPAGVCWRPERQVSGPLQRCRWTRYKWRGGRGRLGHGRSAWSCGGRRATRPLARRAAAPLHRAQR